jgi:hypothetical protein
MGEGRGCEVDEPRCEVEERGAGMSELLTEQEHTTIWMLSQVYRHLRQIISDGSQQEHDLDEAVTHIHVLQHMVMAQAAARAYPDRYRLLGEQLEEE